MKNSKTLFLVCYILFAQYFEIFSQQKDSVTIIISNLGDSINSPYNEYAPVISADGSVLMYTSLRPLTSNKKKIKNLERIWSSEINIANKSWHESKLLSENINIPKRNTSNIALSNDPQKLILYIDEESATGDIYESLLQGSTWSTAIKLPEPINSRYHESSASYSPDLKTIYFVSDRPGGKGGRDIWLSEKNNNGKWDKAINLKNINSNEDEEAVFMYPDGKSLYFSSKRKGGFGAYDIYKTENIKNEWSTPKNIGTPINTDGDDLFFVMEANAKVAYYASDQKGTLGEKDIFKITFNPIDYKKKSDPRLTLLKGVITDEKTGLVLMSDIELIDNEKNEVISKFQSNSSTGEYLISLSSGKNYGINVSAVGYVFQSENINLPDTASYQEIIKNITLKKLEVATKIVLNNIFFDYDKSTIKIESDTELKRLRNLLHENQNLKIEISGHSDNKGSLEYNQKLSESRAKTVADYLITQGINESRLIYIGHAFNQPIASNETEEGRQLNRRTEFKIISK